MSSKTIVKGSNWGGLYSRFSFDETKRYLAMLKESGKPVLDDEFNLLQDAILSQFRGSLADIFGDGSANNGFLVVGSGDANDFVIKGGSLLVDGLRLLLPSDINYSTQDIPPPPLTTPSAPRTDTVYVDAWRDEASPSDDAGMVDPTLNVETSRRLKLFYKVGVAEGASAPVDYTDANGIPHRIVTIATLTRDAAASIDAGMVTDLRDHLANSMNVRDLATGLAGVDLNTLVSPGLYRKVLGALVSNTPSTADSYVVMVFRSSVANSSGGYGWTQVVVDELASGQSTNIYLRSTQKDNDSNTAPQWNAWTQLADQAYVAQSIGQASAIHGCHRVSVATAGGSFTVPAGVYSMKARLIGAGAGGGGGEDKTSPDHTGTSGTDGGDTKIILPDGRFAIAGGGKAGVGGGIATTGGMGGDGGTPSFSISPAFVDVTHFADSANGTNGTSAGGFTPAGQLTNGTTPGGGVNLPDIAIDAGGAFGNLPACSGGLPGRGPGGGGSGGGGDSNSGGQAGGAGGGGNALELRFPVSPGDVIGFDIGAGGNGGDGGITSGGTWPGGTGGNYEGGALPTQGQGSAGTQQGGGGGGGCDGSIVFEW